MFVSAVWCDASPSPVLQIYSPGFQYTWALSSGKSDSHQTLGCKAMQLGHPAKATGQYVYQSAQNCLEDRLQWMTLQILFNSIFPAYEILESSTFGAPETCKLDKHQKPPCKTGFKRKQQQHLLLSNACQCVVFVTEVSKNVSLFNPWPRYRKRNIDKLSNCYLIILDNDEQHLRLSKATK